MVTKTKGPWNATIESDRQCDTIYTINPTCWRQSIRCTHTPLQCNWGVPYGGWCKHPPTQHNRPCSLRGGIVSEWGLLVLKVVPIVPTLTPKPFLIYVPPFVRATNSVLNRIIITEEITHIKPLRCHLPGNLGRLLPKKAWRDIRCMGNEICINSVAPSLIYFCLFTRSAKGKKGIKKKKNSCRASSCGCVAQVLSQQSALIHWWHLPSNDIMTSWMFEM